MQNWKVRYYSAPLCERNLAIVLVVAAIVVVVVKAVIYDIYCFLEIPFPSYGNCQINISK